MNLLGLDPAASTGFAWTNGVETKSGVWVLNQHHRLSDLFDKIMDVHEHWGPLTKIAFEDASFGSINQNTAAMHNELRGIVRLVAERLNIPTVAYKPASIKKFATGYGAAEKYQMKAACKLVLGRDPRTDDEADALWVMEMARQGLVIENMKRRMPRQARVKAERLF